MGCLSGHISLGSQLKGAMQRVSEPMTGDILHQPSVSGSISIVCSLPRFVVVRPEIIWLTEANSFRMDVDVISNTDWIIE